MGDGGEREREREREEEREGEEKKEQYCHVPDNLWKHHSIAN